MKTLILSALALTILAPSAFAISPCRTETLKAYDCEAYDAATDTRLKLTIARYRVLQDERGRCKTAGQIGESVSANLGVEKQGRFAELYFTKTKPAAPLSQLEAGQPLQLDFYSAGLTTEPERAHAELIPSAEGVQARLDFFAKVIDLYAQPDFQRVEVQGAVACRAR